MMLMHVTGFGKVGEAFAVEFVLMQLMVWKFIFLYSSVSCTLYSCGIYASNVAQLPPTPMDMESVQFSN